MYDPSPTYVSSQETNNGSSQETTRGHPDPNSAHLMHGVNPLRGFSSQDSVGPGWYAMSSGDDGLINILQGQMGRDSPGTYDFVRQNLAQSDIQLRQDQHPTPSPSSSQVTNNYLEEFASQPQIPTLLSGGPTSLPPSHVVSPGSSQPVHAYQHISPAQLIMPLDLSPNPTSPNPYPTPNSAGIAAPSYNNGFDFSYGGDGNTHRRSGSAASHNTAHTTSNSFSGSECSYSATDVSESEDAEMEQAEAADGVGELGLGRMGLKGEKTWTQYDQDNIGAAEGSASKATKGAAGQSRRASDGGGAAKAEVDKLEHRRSINRKSAQKHRARRKEEAEESALKVAQRDAKIAQLERDLAVERARVQELEKFLNMRRGSGPAGAGNAVDGQSGGEDAGPAKGQEEKKTDGRKTRGMRRGETLTTG